MRCSEIAITALTKHIALAPLTMVMHRRLLIAVGAVLALGVLAGCSAAGSLQMTPVDDTALAKEASLSATGGGFSPGSGYRGRAGEIIENGSGTILAPDPPLETDQAYEYERQYYTFSSEIVEEVPGAATLVSIDYNAQQPNGTTIQFRNLSPADKRELEPVLSWSPPELREGSEIDDLVVYTAEEREESLIAEHADDYVTIRYRGERYELEVKPVRDMTLERYRYEATRIADSPEAYASQLKREYAFTLRGASESEQTVLEEAISDGYYADTTDDDAFASLVERFRRHQPVLSNEYHGSYVVRYDGQLYWAEMDYGQFVDADRESMTSINVTPH